MDTFTTVILELAQDVQELFLFLGFNSKLYTICDKKKLAFTYHVRLSKNVNEFVKIVNPQKI